MAYIIRHQIRFLVFLTLIFIGKEGSANVIDFKSTALMVDSICTNTTKDTFLTFTTKKTTLYTWQLPLGAILVDQPNDTTAIIDWQNATIGDAQLCVLAENNCGESLPVCIDVFIQHCNTPPIAMDDNLITFFELPTTIFVQNNDSDPDNDDLATLLDSNAPPSNGTIELLGTAIQYIPNDGFTGVDSFQYILCDNGHPFQCDSALVRVTVDHQAPIGTNDFISTPSNSSVAIPVLINDSDPEGSDLLINLDTNSLPFNGTIMLVDQEIVYTPAEGFTGTDRFEYIVCDSNTPQKCDRATVTVVVVNQVPNANDDAVKIPAILTSSIQVLDNDTDKENGNLTVSINTSQLPINGQITTNGLEINYTPNVNFTGVDSFEYVLCDDGIPVLCDTAAVVVQVVNDVPIAMDDLILISSNSDTLLAVLANDIDPESGTLIVSLHPVDTAKNGTVTLSDQQIQYIPTPNFTGNDTLSYYICDDGSPIQCDTATVLIMVLNSPPIAISDEISTLSGLPTCHPVLANDIDAEQGELRLSLDTTKSASNGSVTLTDQSICYTPDTGFSGLDSLCYIICDDGMPVQCDTATLSWMVINQPPDAVEDVALTKSGEPICIEVVANDSDPEFGLVMVSVDASKLPKHGTVVSQNNEICYTPSDNFTGVDSLSYVLCDDGIPLKCDTANIIIRVDNIAPIANNDVVTTNSNEEVCVEVLENDEDRENGFLMIFLDTSNPPLDGVATIRNEVICYLPQDGFSGLDSLGYIICDDGIPSKCDTATLILTIFNLPPIAKDDIVEIPSDSSLSIPILENDSDPENKPLTVTIDTNGLPTNGVVSISNDSLMYTPNLGFTGIDELQYSICDNGIPNLCDTATVSITIINQAPIAIADIIETPFDMAVTIPVLTNDSDPENGQLAVTINPNSLPTNGSILLQNDRIIYTPFRGFNGEDTFDYIICDDGIPSLCDTTTVTVLVLNDAPIAVDDAVATPSNTGITISVTENDFDPEAEVITVALDNTTTPNNGSISQEGNELIYTPNLNYTGLDTFRYILCDDGVPAQCDTAVVTITIENIAPTAEPDFVTTPFETPISIPYLSNDNDSEEGVLTVLDSPDVLAENGSIEVIDNELVYTPNNGFTGIDQFSYLLCDDGIPIQCDTALVTVVVPNTKPVAVDDSVSLSGGLPFTRIAVLENDSDKEHNNFTLHLNDNQLLDSGTAEVTGDSILYTPAYLFVGRDSFDYVICDTGTPILCDTATVFVSINNNPPVAVNDTFNILEDQSFTSNILENDSDPNAHPLVVLDTLLTLPSLGILTFQEVGTFQYTPFANTNGLDKFTYIVCDSVLLFACDTATVCITIAAMGDAPLALEDINITLKNTPVDGIVLTNDIDPDGDELFVNPIPLSDPTNGLVLLDIDGNYTYTPDADFIGKDWFQYEVCDTDDPARCDTATVQILVVDEKSNQNRPPLGIADHFQSTMNTLVTSNVLLNDADPDGDAIGIQTVPVQEPKKGELTLLSNGKFTYQPETDFTGAISFQYVVYDLGTPSLMDTALVTIEILPSTSNTIFAVDDAFLGEEDQTISGNILANDIDPENDLFSVSTIPILPPQQGTILLQEDGSFLYAPKLDYYGPDYFVYEVCDEGMEIACDQATVVLNIFPVNDTLCTSNLPLPTIASNKRICIEDTLQLFTTSPYPPITLEEKDTTYSFIWLNGNGDTITVTKESQAFIAARDSLAIPPFSMKVRQGACASGFSNLLNIEVVEIPTATIFSTLKDTSICQFDPITLSTEAVPNVQYAWSINNDTTILSSEPSLFFNELDRTTTIKLIVNSSLCSIADTLAVNIEVRPLPQAAIAAVDSMAICSGNTFTLKPITDSLPYQYFWMGPKNFISTARSPQIRNATTANAGVYQLIIQDQLGCQSAPASIAITSIQEVLSPPTIIGGTDFCSSANIELGLLEPYDSTFTIEWINGNGNPIGTEARLNLSTNDSLALSPFRVKVNRQGCSSSFSSPYVIHISESPVAKIITSTSTLCTGSTLSISAKPSENVAYEWRSLSSNTLLSTANSTILANIQDDLAIELAVFNQSCPEIVSKDTLLVTIESNNTFQPTASFVLNEDCSPANLTLNANLPTSILDVNWVGPNGFIADQPIVNIQDATEAYNGTYQVSATDSSGCKLAAILTINDLQESVAIPTITSVEGAVCENSNILLEVPSYEGQNLQYIWYENDRLISDSSGNRLFVDNAKIDAYYEVEVIGDNCSSKASPFYPIVLEKPRLLIEEIAPLSCATGSEEVPILTRIQGGQAPLNLSWIGPNNFVSALPSPTIINATSKDAGTYTLTVIDQNNCSAVSSIEIDIQEGIPIPAISKEGGNCIGNPINLTTNLDDATLSYDWSFPSSIGVSSITSPIISIPVANEKYIGTYQVTASKGACTVQSDSFTLVLAARPTFKPTANYIPLDNCKASDLSLFANTTSNNVTYEWTGPNGFTSAIANPVILSATPANNGLYELTVSTQEGCTATVATELVHQISTAQSKPILQSTGISCSNDFTTITAPLYQGDSVQYNWLLNGMLLPNEQSNQLVIQASNHQEDQYQVLVQIDGCTLTSDPYSPSIIAIPSIATITKSAIYCEGASVQLTAQSTMPIGQSIEYTWRGPNGFEYINTTTTNIFDLELMAITSEQAGSYSLSLRIGDCFSETQSVVVSIRSGLVAPTLEVEEQAVCAGNQLRFTANTTVNTLVEYEWYLQLGGDSLVHVETTTTPTLHINNATSTNSGNYLVRVINEECSSNFSNIESVLVFDIATDFTALSTATEEQPGCYGEPIQLSVPFYPNATYKWIGPAGFSSTRHNPIIENASALDEGDYLVMVTMEGCQTIVSKPVTVRVNPKPPTPIISSNSPICIGENLSFQVNNAANFGLGILFDWYNSDQILVANTPESFRDFSNLPTEFSNNYYAIATHDGCISEPSNSIEVRIAAAEGVVANAGIDQQFCAVNSVKLNAVEVTTGIGEWQSLSGASIENSLNHHTIVQDLLSGNNQFVWTVNDPVCGGLARDTVNIFIGTSTLDQAIAGIDQQVCETNSITLDALPLLESVGTWSQSPDQISQGVEIISPNAPNTTIKGLSPGNSYRFTWVISQNDCPNFESDEVMITVDDIPNEQAVIPKETIFLCTENGTHIEAEMPILSTGLWSVFIQADSLDTPAPSPIKIASPTSASTFLEGVRPGKNKLVWSLSNGGCKQFSSDTLFIYSEGNLRANRDAYTLNFNDSLALNILDNDIITAPETMQLIITRYPEFGSIREEDDGTLTYLPTLNYFGRDQFRYKICPINCTEACDTALVDIAISGVEGSGSCFIPNTISPNEDGSNDVFLVSCLNEFPDNELSIFNRWGDKVFESAPYKNNWQGDFEGQPLPAGTYFYALKLTEEDVPLQGFISLFR